MMRFMTMLLAGVLLTATACTSSAPPKDPVPDPKPAAGACSAEAPPAPETGVVKGAWIVPSKEQAKPGEQLSFEIRTAAQSEITRGIGSTLECWNGSQWVATHTLVSGTNPSAYPIGENVAIIDIALIGPGPEQIKLPEGLTPGFYRIRKEVTLTANNQGQNVTAFGRVQVTK